MHHQKINFEKATVLNFGQALTGVEVKSWGKITSNKLVDYLPSPWWTAKWCGSSRLHPTPPPACPPWVACPCHLSIRVPMTSTTRARNKCKKLHSSCCYWKSVLNCDSHTRNKGPVLLTTQAILFLLFLAQLKELKTASHHHKPRLTFPDPHVAHLMQ